MAQKITELEEADKQRLQEQTEVVQKLLTEHFDNAGLNGSQDDLATLQAIIDEKLFQPDQTYELQCLGIVLGNVLSQQPGLHWIMVEDEYGRDPAIQYEQTSLILFPLTMISKRIEDGVPANVQELFDISIAQIDQLKNYVDPAGEEIPPPQASAGQFILAIIAVVIIGGVILVIYYFVNDFLARFLK